MEANDDEIHFVSVTDHQQQSNDSVLQEQVDTVIINRKFKPSKKPQVKTNFVVVLIFVIVMVVEGILYLDARQKSAASEHQSSVLASDVARFELQNKRLKTSLREIKEKQAKLIKIAESASRSYLNDALRNISAYRRQSSGMMAAPNGTVSELKQLIKNADGRRYISLLLSIQNILYNSEQIRKERLQFNHERIALLQKNSKLQSLGLSKFTLKTNHQLDTQQHQQQTREYLRINQVHNLSSFPSQLPMCLIVPSYNNNAKFRLQYNLNSIFSQNYTNYFAVIINDASNDGSDELIRNYLLFYNISPDRYVYLDNGERKTALENIYNAVWNYCSEDSIVVNLDGDDEFIGKNVLKIFNTNYQKTRMGMIYSNYHRVYDDLRIEKGRTGQYSDQVKKIISFRTSEQLFSHLKTHRAELFRRIPLKELQDNSGHFFKITSDMAIYYPLMELACGRVLKINGFHYLYNFGTGLNDYTLNHKQQLEVESRIRNGKKVPCASDLLKKWDK